MDTIKVGFIGCGGHSGKRLYPALKAAGLQLVAVCDLDVQKARARAAEFDVKGVYADYREMCDREKFDAVLVAIGPQAHYELSIPLLKRGYHVWTEKPCAYNAAQADEMVLAAEKAGKILQTGFNYRYTVGLQKVMGMIESGQFASPALVAVRWWLGVTKPLEFMHHYMVHALDLLNYLAPGPLRKMHVEHHRHDGFDYFMITFRTDAGRIAVLELTANMHIAGHWCRVDWMSRDGMLSVRDFTEVTHYRTALSGQHGGKDAPAYDGDHVWRTEPLIAKGPFVETWGYLAGFDRFRKAILGQGKPECTIQGSAWGMHVCEDLMKIAAEQK